MAGLVQSLLGGQSNCMPTQQQQPWALSLFSHPLSPRARLKSHLVSMLPTISVMHNRRLVVGSSAVELLSKPPSTRPSQATQQPMSHHSKVRARARLEGIMSSLTCRHTDQDG